MKVKLVIVAMSAVLSLAALTSSASAAGPINWREGLQLSELGTPVKPGAAVFNDQLILSNCQVQSTAKLLNNDNPIDLLTAGATTYTYCEAGTVSSRFQLLELADNGTATIAPDLTLTTPGPCVYFYPLLTGTFQIGGESIANVTGTGTGYRQRGSVSSCAPTITSPFESGLVGSVDDQALQTELVSKPAF
jgi:hypothetical protein